MSCFYFLIILLDISIIFINISLHFIEKRFTRSIDYLRNKYCDLAIDIIDLKNEIKEKENS